MARNPRVKGILFRFDLKVISDLDSKKVEKKIRSPYLAHIKADTSLSRVIGRLTTVKNHRIFLEESLFKDIKSTYRNLELA
jgi:pullulanase/glycogen debranching enzyme